MERFMEKTRRSSKKRQAILDEFRNSREHPSAEQIYSRLKPQIPDLSLGTVYRNIGVLLDDGFIISVGTVNGEERFDACAEPHAHFVCSVCSGVYDIPIENISTPDYEKIESATGGKVNSHALSFKGVCKKCCKK